VLGALKSLWMALIGVVADLVSSKKKIKIEDRVSSSLTLF
jgi:hypothetical protein